MANEKRYQWQKVAAPFTNTGDRWACVMGADVVATIAQQNLYQVKDAQGGIIDTIVMDLVTVTAVGEEFILAYLPRKLMVPPGGQVVAAGNPNLSVVICGDTSDRDGKDSLENAVIVST